MQEVRGHVDESTIAPSEPVVLPFEDLGFVEFAVAGTSVAGEFRCTDCGYGAVVHRALPPCPMCGGTIWECRGPVASRFAG